MIEGETIATEKNFLTMLRSGFFHMQGTLNEIDIRSILKLIELGQRTGELFIESYQTNLPIHPEGDVATQHWFNRKNLHSLELVWFVFFVNGQIAYATDNTNNNLLRLRDYLYHYQAEEALDKIQSSSIEVVNTPEYDYLWLMLEGHILTPAQGRSIIQNMVQENLFDLFSLHQGDFVFETSSALAPQLTTLEIDPLVRTIIKQLQQWKQFYPHIQFPDQSLVVTDKINLREALSQNAYKSICRWADGKTSLRQLSRYLNRDLLTITQAIYPYVKQGWIQPVNGLTKNKVDFPQILKFTEVSQTPHIVCIDDDVTIGKRVEQIIQAKGYKTTLINDPLKALSLVFQIQPNLILCDIDMPKLDGYEICAMLRRSKTFRQTPIIMLTGKEGFIDRVRARMVGSTDYLTKPFGESELLMLLEKYIGLGITQHLSKINTS